MLLGGSGFPAADEPPAPCYKFRAGQELIYRGLTRTASGGVEEPGDETLIRLCVLRERPGPEWLILALAFPAGGRSSAALINVKARGQVEMDPGFQDLYYDTSFLFLVLPRLPDHLEGRPKWHFDGGPLLDRYECTLEGKDARDRLIIKFGKSNLAQTDSFYRVSAAGGWEFDPAQGRVVQSESVAFQEREGPDISSKTVTLFSESVEHGEAWAAELLREARVFSSAAQATARDQALIMSGRANADAKLVESRRRWTDLAPLISEKSPLLPFWRSESRRIEKDAAYYRRGASQIAKQLDRPAPDWTLADFAGREMSLAGLRGKVLLLYFWNTDSGWCILTMPQIMGLSDYFAGKGVAVLGMNTDEDPTRARELTLALGLNYANLQAMEARKLYDPPGYPALYVVDKEGAVRHIHIGWSRDLGQNVAAEVENLLEGNRPGP